jgi:hypothetical protein
MIEEEEEEKKRRRKRRKRKKNIWRKGIRRRRINYECCFS